MLPIDDIALVVGSTVRLTRLVTDDMIGQWWVKDPAWRAAVRSAQRRGKVPWWDRYRDGLECPWCVGFWIGAGVLLTHRRWGQTPAWRLAAEALTLNLVAAPITARLAEGGDPGGDED